MPIQSNTNVSPYWDDFDPDKNFYRVLFKPGYPVQARELTQLQTILGDQVEKLASKFFKNGDNIVPGHYNLSIPTSYVRLSSITQGSRAKDFEGYTVTGVISGAKAYVNFAEEATDTDDHTFYVNYVDSGDTTEEVTFVEGEVLESDTPDFFTAQVGVKDTSKPITSPPIGFGSIFTVEEGSYYVNGFMVKNQRQTISLEKYDVTPTCEVGFIVDEQYVDVNDDPSLLDNSQGSSNFAAPGADRLKIDLILSTRVANTEIPNFIPLINLVQGNIVGSPCQTVKWDWLYDVLARRTFDESGDYIVTDFDIKPMEYWDYAIIDGDEYNPVGLFDPEPDVYGRLTPYPPVPDTNSTQALSFLQADSKYVLNISPGKAYVQGYEVGVCNPFYIYGDKPRTLSFKDDTNTLVNPGIFLKVSNTFNSPDFVNDPGKVTTEAFKTIVTYRNFTDGHVGTGFVGKNYNTSVDSLEGRNFDDRPLNIGNDPWTTFHIILHKNAGDISQIVDEESKVQIKKRSGEILTGIVIYPDPKAKYDPIEDPKNILTDGNQTTGGKFIYNEPDLSTLASEGEDGGLTLTTSVGKSMVICLVDRNGVPYDYEANPNAPTIDRGDIVVNNTIEEPRVLVTYQLDPMKAGIIQPKYFYPDNSVYKRTDDDSNTFFGYNSTFNLGVMSSEYFTELAVYTNPDDKDFEQEWILGSLLKGVNSGAIGKLEQVRKVSSYDFYLTISNVRGQFVNGEDVFQATGLDDGEDETNNIYLFTDGPSSQDVRKIRRQTQTGNLLLDTEIKYTVSRKTGTLHRDGEIVGFSFNDYIGSEDQGWNGGGGDKDFVPGGSLIGSGSNYDKPIYTPDVNLVYASDLRKLGRVGMPTDLLSTQKEANDWFYSKIITRVRVQDEPPTDPDKDDIWVDTKNYVLYVWNGNYWIGITPISENLNSTPTTVTAAAIPPTFEQEQETAAQSSDTATSLEKETDIFVYSVGAVLQLSTANSGMVTRSSTGVAVPDLVYDRIKNTLNLTKTGRDKIYNFAFFNPEQSVSVSRINYEVVTAQNKLRGFGVVLPAKITNTLKKTKAFYSPLGDPLSVGFSADVDLVDVKSSEITNVANGSLFSGSGGYSYVSCDDFAGDASEELVAGDIVTFTDDQGRIQYKLVMFVTKPQGYGNRRTRCTIYFSTTIDNNVTGHKVSRLRIKSFGNGVESSIYQLPVSVVKSLESNNNATGINYQIFRQFSEAINGQSQAVTIKVRESNERFISDPLKVSIVVAKVLNGTDDEIKNLEGRTLALDSIEPIQDIQDGGGQITYKLQSMVSNNIVVKVIAPVEVLNAKAKRKKLKKNHEVLVAYDANNQATPELSPASQQIITLGKADGYKLRTVSMERITEGVSEYVDVTDNYVFDDGQRDTYYGLATVIRKTNSPTVTGNLKVVFDYFEHHNPGGEITDYEGNDGADFFSVDSYTHDEGILYDDIPVYKPNAFVKQNTMTAENQNLSIKLRDCVDFRPVVNTAALGSEEPVLTKKLSENCTNFMDPPTFAGSNAFAPYMPIPFSTFRSDIEYYLPKIDTLFVDKTGKMILTPGVPSPNPTAPPDLATGIRLYDLYMPAYTFDIKDIVIRKHNYRRYTMKDIYDIDKRVDRVEKLVSLTMLEIAALNATVRDASTGLDRFKNGILVDPFIDHSKGDVGSEQYRASIDPKEGHLRPPFLKDQITLEERNNTDEARNIFGFYRNTGNILTCDYTNTKLVEQPSATKHIQIQTNSSFTHEGFIALSPAVDTFYNNYQRSEMVLERSDVYNAELNRTDTQVQSGIGTVWTDWETNGRLPSDKTNQLGRESNNKKLSPSVVSDYYSTGTLKIAPSSSAAEKARDLTLNSHGVSTGMTLQTSYGDRVVDMQLADTMRSIPVYFTAQRLKPNTTYYAMMEDIDISDWVCVDDMERDFNDNKARYVMSPNSTPIGFGSPIVSDSQGNISGVFIVPNGRPPIKGQTFTGNMDEVEYQTSGPTRSFKTGQRTFKLTTSKSNFVEGTKIEGYAKTDFVSRAVLNDKQDTVVSTRQAEITTNYALAQDVRLKAQQGVTPSVVPTPYDPLAQTFRVDRNSPDGVFATEIDLYFRSKDNVQGIEVYMVDTDGATPSNRIVPHSRVVKNSDTIIRVGCQLAAGVNSTTINAGTVVVGQTSGASGQVKVDVRFDSESVNTNNNVNAKTYNLIIDNYTGDFLPDEILVPEVNPAKKSTFKIVKDEVNISRIEVETMGSGYNIQSTVEIGPPNLPGGRRATAELKYADVSETLDPEYRLNGEIYEIVVTDSGSGYTEAPSVSISGTGSGATAIARVVEGRKSVDMGVSTSDDATAPTKFKFSSPVYLLGNTTYAFVVKCPTSTSYDLWVSKSGENVVGTTRRAVNQFTQGALFTSSDSGIWTEDQNTDIKFKLHRAEFSMNEADIRLNNAPFLPRTLISDPIETSEVRTVGSSNKFGEDSNVVRVHHFNHGLIEGDYVLIQGVTGTPNGISDSALNKLHKVIDVSINNFTIKVEGDFTTVKGRAGGSTVTCSFNRPYEVVNLYSGAMTFPGTSIQAFHRGTQFAGMPVFNPANADTIGYNQQNSYKIDTETEDIPLMDSYYFNKSKVVANRYNESLYSDDSHLRGEKSLEVTFNLRTSNPKLSPVIDLDRTNLITVRNLVDNPSGFEPISGTRTAVLSFNKSITRSGVVAGGSWSILINRESPERHLLILLWIQATLLLLLVVVD